VNEVLEYIELQGHVTYDELERRYGDGVYEVVERLLLTGKISRALSGVMSERQRQQNKLDEFWENKRWWEEHHRKSAERQSFHKAPGDPDFPKDGDTSVERRRRLGFWSLGDEEDLYK
jgi:hypothetical protein